MKMAVSKPGRGPLEHRKSTRNLILDPLTWRWFSKHNKTITRKLTLDRQFSRQCTHTFSPLIQGGLLFLQIYNPVVVHIVFNCLNSSSLTLDLLPLLCAQDNDSFEPCAHCLQNDLRYGLAYLSPLDSAHSRRTSQHR